MIYASRTAESLNSDPTPIFNRTTGGRHTDDGYGALEDDQIVWKPRPSFTPKTTHPANPVLTEFREVVAGLGHRPLAVKDEIKWWIDCLGEPASLVPKNGYHWTLDQIEHAKRVFERLASFHA